jgi:hypothetical protein
LLTWVDFEQDISEGDFKTRPEEDKNNLVLLKEFLTRLGRSTNKEAQQYVGITIDELQGRIVDFQGRVDMYLKVCSESQAGETKNTEPAHTQNHPGAAAVIPEGSSDMETMLKWDPTSQKLKLQLKLRLPQLEEQKRPSKASRTFSKRKKDPPKKSSLSQED